MVWQGNNCSWSYTSRDLEIINILDLFLDNLDIPSDFLNRLYLKSSKKGKY